MSEIADFSFLKDYVPYEGDGQAVLLPFDGDIKAKIVRLKKGKSNTGNDTLKVVMNVAEDGFAGTLYKDIPYTGERSDGKHNMVGLADLLISAGWTLEQIQQFASQEQKVQIDKIIQQLMGGTGTVFVSVAAEVYNGKETSKVTNFIKPSTYADRVRNGQARRPRVGATSVSNGAASTKPTTTTGGSDPLANLM